MADGRRWRSRIPEGARTVLLVAFAIATALLVSVVVRQSSGAESSASNPPALALPKPVLLFGDSYAAGTGATRPDRAWAAQLASAQGWNLVNEARGGTGYIKAFASNGTSACGRDECPNFDTMLSQGAQDVPQPGLVLVFGGRNDAAMPATTETAAIQKFYRDARRAFPKTRIVAISPIWDDDTPPASMGVMKQSVQKAAQSVGATYLDIGEPLSKQPDLVVADGVHPSDAGHAAIFKIVQQRLKAAHIS